MGRFFNWLKAIFNRGMDRIEDPEIMLDQARRDMQSALSQNQEKAIQAITQRNQLEKMLQDHLGEVQGAGKPGHDGAQVRRPRTCAQPAARKGQRRLRTSPVFRRPTTRPARPSTTSSRRFLAAARRGPKEDGRGACPQSPMEAGPDSELDRQGARRAHVREPVRRVSVPPKRRSELPKAKLPRAPRCRANPST